MARRRRSTRRRKSSSRRKPLKVRSNGRLRRAAGVKKGKMTRAKARRVKRTGTPAQRRSANFYLNVLSKPKRRRKSKSSRSRRKKR